MSTVNDTSSASAYSALNGAASKGTANTTKDIQDRFLTLLVAQLKNQDPLNPLANAQVTTQLSQISTVTGLEKLNSSLSSLSEMYNSGQAMQAAGMLGKLVLVPGSGLTLSKGVGIAGIDLAASAGNVTVSVKDSTGKTVYTEDLGAHKAGSTAFVWDGTTDSGEKAADGNYTFTVTANSNGTEVTVKPLQAGTVSAVVRGANGFTLDLGAAGQVSFADVKQIL